MLRGVGAQSIVRILARNDLERRTPEEFIDLSPEVLREEYKLPMSVLSNWSDSWNQAHAEAIEIDRQLAKFKVDIVTAADVHFPDRILQMDPDACGILFLYGNHKLLSARTFSVLASRDCSEADLLKIEELAESGVLAGEVLVSGHDTPAYQRSAIVPLRWGAPRILVLDSGLFSALGEELTEEPFRAARLWRYKFDPQCDLVISPCVPKAAGHRNSNRIRDRLIGALSDRIDMVSLARGGNMEQIARMATKCNRPLRINEQCDAFAELLQRGASPLP